MQPTTTPANGAPGAAAPLRAPDTPKPWPKFRAAPPDEVLDELTRRLNALGRASSLEQARATGLLLVDLLYGGDLAAWRARGRKEVGYRRLVARRNGGGLSVPASALSRDVSAVSPSAVLTAMTAPQVLAQLITGVHARFTAAGVRLGSDLQVRTTAIGRAGNPTPLQFPTPVSTTCAGAPCAKLDAGDVVESWVEHDGGFEQRWTIGSRPAGSGALVVDVAITGGALAANGAGATLDGPSGEAWTIGDVRAWDAAGVALPTQLTVAAGAIHVLVTDTGARYPVTVDPTYRVREADYVVGGTAFTVLGDIDGRAPSVVAPYADLLGTIPDGAVGAMAGVSRDAVKEYRKRLGIAPFRLRPVAEPAPGATVGASAPAQAASLESGRSGGREAKGRPRASKIDAFAHLVGVEADREVAQRAGVTVGNVQSWRTRRGIAASQSVARAARQAAPQIVEAAPAPTGAAAPAIAVQAPAQEPAASGPGAETRPNLEEGKFGHVPPTATPPAAVQGTEPDDDGGAALDLLAYRLRATHGGETHELYVVAAGIAAAAARAAAALARRGDGWRVVAIEELGRAVG